jgi:hypothetical protein
MTSIGKDEGLSCHRSADFSRDLLKVSLAKG